MAAFATSADLAIFTGDDSLDGVRGVMLVDQASAAIRGYCRQTFDLVEDDEVELRGRWSHKLPLPERPVVSVSSVTIEGVEVSAYRLVRDVLYRVGPGEDFDLHGSGRSWGGPTRTVTVTYTHGFAADHPALETLKGVCVQVAARAAVNTTGVTSESIGDWSASYGNGGGGFALTAAEQSVLDRFRHEYATA